MKCSFTTYRKKSKEAARPPSFGSAIASLQTQQQHRSINTRYYDNGTMLLSLSLETGNFTVRRPL